MIIWPKFQSSRQKPLNSVKYRGGGDLSKAVYVSIRKCIACHACEIACLRIHNGSSYISVEVVDNRGSVPLLCRQCENATCVSACYTNALAVGDDGIVSFDKASCTGCGLCVLACPFGVISLGKDLVEKCDQCLGRDVPVCVLTCPANALTFGEQDLFNRAVRRRAGQNMLKAISSTVQGGVKNER